MIKQTPHSKKPLIWTIVIIAVLLVALGTIGYIKNWWHLKAADTNITSKQDDSGKSSSIDTTDNQAVGEKAEPGNSTSTSQNSNNDKKVVQVGVTSSTVANGSLTIRAFVQGVIEGTGTCTATLTKAPDTVTASSAGFIDATTTQCTPISINLSDFKETGIWNLVVSYSSDTSNGVSASSEVHI